MEPLADRARSLTLRAAEETWERIDRDRERVSVQLEPILDEIKERLLDQDLDAESLLEGREVNAFSLAKRFSEELDLSLWTYVIDCRMKTAVRLLLGTDLVVWRIGVNVGYKSGHNFSRGFKKWSGGKTPTEFRRAAAKRTGAQPEAVGLRDDIERLESVARGMSGEAALEEAAVTVRRLEAATARIYLRYWDLDPPTPEQERAELAVARNVWRAIEELPPEEWRAAVESQSGCRTSAFFHYLCARSYEIADEDPERGLEIARLAPVALAGLAPQIDEPLLLSYEARASLVLAHSLHRAGDPDAAAEALAAAEEKLDTAGEDAYLPVISELKTRKGLFLISRGDYREGFRLLKAGNDLAGEVLERLRPELLQDRS